MGLRCSPACRGTVPSLQLSMSIISKTHPEIGWLVNFESSVLRGPVKLSTGPSSCPKKLISKFLGESNIQVERHIFAFSGQYPPSTGFLWFCIFPNFFETRLDVCLLCAQRALLMKICKSVRENPWWFNYSKVLLTSPAHGVHVFRSAKKDVVIISIGSPHLSFALLSWLLFFSSCCRRGTTF